VLIMLNGGAPIFGHVRIGRGGRPFRCLKFRTMTKDADKVLVELIARDPTLARQWELNFKLDVDPRITRVGKFLRKTSLDELPQLFNVLRGEMSLVGPRPVVADELTRYYGADVFYYRLVRPGITGLWQVNGRSQTSYERRVFLDAWYVRNWNLWTDLVILFNTVPTAILGTGAQ
jgi:lipopolysaccharide/colanic/teichoic acid biosynthesis glycosyltransferase